MSPVIISGTGLGFRSQYLDVLLAQTPASIQWFELLVDHFHNVPSFLLTKIDTLLSRYPCVLHGVNLSLGSLSPLNANYLQLIDDLIARFNPAWISDHLCASEKGDYFFHDLIPIPFTEARLDLISFKIDALQSRLKIPFLIENISSYVRFSESTMREGVFLRRLIEKTGCGLLLDVNNIVVTTHNHGESVAEFLSDVPLSAVKQMHLAGFETQDQLLIDSHSRITSDDVFNLFIEIQQQAGPIPTCLEWDNDLPDFSVIKQELARIDALVPSPLRGRRWGEAPDEGVQCAPEPVTHYTEPEFYTTLMNPESICPPRINIYRTSILGTLTKTLNKTFKALEVLIGREAFQETCYRYAVTHFSKKLNLTQYGEDFSEFISTAPFAENIAYLPDFTEFLFCWRAVFLDPTLSGMRLESDYPLYEIWKRCQPEFKGDLSIENWQGPFVMTLYREDGKVRVVSEVANQL